LPVRLANTRSSARETELTASNAKRNLLFATGQSLCASSLERKRSTAPLKEHRRVPRRPTTAVGYGALALQPLR
jgi:hypothetical protein